MQLVDRPAPPGAWIDSYCLASTMLTLVPAKDKPGVDIAVARVPDEVAAALAGGGERGFARIAIERHDQLFVRTTLNLDKVENSCLPTKVGAEVTDQRVDAIKGIGRILVTALGIAGGPEGPPPPPVEVNLLAAMETAGIRRGAGTVPETALDGAGSLRVLAVPPDALDRGAIRRGARMRGLYYSACRIAQLDPAAPGQLPLRFAIADPRYVQFVAFPRKGSVSFHGQCGVSIASVAADGTASPVAVAGALVDALKDVRAAADKPD